MSNHTPGPWKVECGSVYTADDRPIATMVRSRDAVAAGIFATERDANAQLIAAAPELLEALTCLYEDTAEYIVASHLWVDVHHNRGMRMARDALAKAKGEPTC